MYHVLNQYIVENRIYFIPHFYKSGWFLQQLSHPICMVLSHASSKSVSVCHIEQIESVSVYTHWNISSGHREEKSMIFFLQWIQYLFDKKWFLSYLKKTIKQKIYQGMILPFSWRTRGGTPTWSIQGGIPFSVKFSVELERNQRTVVFFLSIGICF